MRPIVSNREEPNGDRFAWFLPPLGFVKDDASLDATVAQFLPLARYQRTPEANGFMSWSLLVLPGIYWASHSDGRIQRAFFPFFGLVEKFLSWDRATFALFPLWIRIERFGRTTDYVLWPFFSVSRGTGGFGWRVWPLVGHNSWEGRYSRWFAAWPFLHFQQNDLQYPEDQQQRSWFLWPLVGQSRRGPAHQTTVLWPFFGHTDDPETGFWATDAPWFLVRFQGGDPDRAVRKRVWPFYSYYEGDGLTSRWYAWPFIRQRREEYPDGTKEGLNVFPFWRSSTRVREPLVVGDVEVERRSGRARSASARSGRSARSAPAWTRRTSTSSISTPSRNSTSWTSTTPGSGRCTAASNAGGRPVPLLAGSVAPREGRGRGPQVPQRPLGRA